MFKKLLIINLLTKILLIQSNNSPEQILASMSLRQKIGQIFIVAAASNFEQPNEMLASMIQTSPYNLTESHVNRMILDYHVGGIIFLYKSNPATQMQLAKKFNALSSIPLLFAQDSEWGLSMRLDLDPKQVVRYPHNLTLGAVTNPNIIYEIGYKIGQDCAAIGIQLNLAPVIDVNNNPLNPVIHDRSFGDNPKRVATLATLFMQGLQAGGVMACAKHFPGHGDTCSDSHFSLPTITRDKTQLDQVELVPFKDLIKQQIDSIMLGHLAVPSLDETNTPTSLSSKVVTDLLQHKLGFNGLIITDSLGMQAVMQNYAGGELELAAFLAGNDLLLCPLDIPRAIDLIEQAIILGKISVQELDRRILKILRAKELIFKKQINLTKNISNTANFLIRPAALELQTRAYRAAITLVKKNPLINFSQTNFKKSCLIQIGKLNQNCFGKTCNNLNKQVLEYSAKLNHQELENILQITKNQNRIIIALGELNKFAVQNFGISKNTLELITSLKQTGKQVVIILFGTPYALKFFKDVDASIIAYEDLSITQIAAVDVLTSVLKPTGVLPIKIN